MKTGKGILIWGLMIILEIVIIIGLAFIIEKKSIQLIALKQKLAIFEQKNQNLVTLDQDNQNLFRDLELINDLIPTKEKIISFVSDLETQASESGIPVKISFGGDSLKAENNAKSLKVNFNMETTYFSLLEFIKKVEELPQVIEVSRVNIQSPGGLENKNNIILVLKTYVDKKF